ncbi:MAG: thioredoxin domain-containing protein, partial [Deltaproteobacteria bacterium]
YYDVTPQGNFEGKNILHRPLPDEAVAGRLGIDVATLRATIEGAKKKLYAHRAKRVPPLTDTKVLAAWNGLTISAFARGAFVLDVPRYRERAIRAGRFLLDRMYAGGRLMRSFKDGAAKQAGFLNDYVFVAEAFLDLYEVTFEPVWLTKAIALQEVLEAHFRDAKGGGWFLTSDEHESLLFREKPAYDGAIPSGNSAIVLNLLRFYEFTTEDRYRQRAEETLGFLSGTLEQSPTSLPRALCGLDFLLDRAKEIVLVEPAGGGKLDPFLAQLRSRFLPNRILVAVREGKPLDALAATVPLVEGKIAQEGKVTAYVCEAGRCELPTTDPAIFARQLQDQKEKSSSPSGQ